MPLPTTILENKLDNKAKGLSLLIIGPETVTSIPLPPTGVVTIGRAEDADVRLDDPLISRLHARLHVAAGPRLEIEDLGSINQTKVREVPIAAGQRLAITPGEPIGVGGTTLVVQVITRTLARPRRVWPHVYFEARLEEECARSQDSRAPFAAVRLHVDRGSVPAAVAEIIAPALRVPDVLALYAPNEYELLFPSTTPDLALALGKDMVERLRAGGVTARAGTACYPRDGRTPEMLLALACERVLRTVSTGKDAPPRVVEDPAMQRLYELAARVAVGNINVLLLGETGVGKEVLAETIHRLSPRARAPLVCLNCAALSESLLESEFFGHERGAFTGATEAKAGLLESAQGGTVFLDEIGEMPAVLQAKLLRVIESRQVTRVGGVKSKAIDVRFIAATNRNLELDVTADRFRRDLYFRLNGVTLQMPPLRDRPSEVMPLARGFVAQFAGQLGQQPPAISEEAEDLLTDYAWPGNIRELRNVVERAVLLCVGGEIRAEHLPVEMMSANSPLCRATGSHPVAAAPENETERDQIVRVLSECAGNQSRAARRLGISRSTLVERLETHQLPRPRKRAE